MRLLPLSAAAAALALAALPARADLAALAECIADSGATYYGAHWCPVCAKQDAMFGEYAYLLPYTECYEPGSRDDQVVGCEHVTGYPTWEFGDGKVRKGALSPRTLAAATGCAPP